MTKRLRIDAQAILADIRSGLGDVPIMEKYDLSPSLYRKILETLRSKGVATFADLRDRMKAVAVPTEDNEKRAARRNYILYDMPVYNANEPGAIGTLNDISDVGLQVSGMDVEVNDLVTLLIRSDGFDVHSPFTLDAICRWVDREMDTGRPTAGFEIMSILGRDERELRKLVEELAVPDSARSKQ